MKSLLFFVFIASGYSAFACRCVPENLEKLRKDISKAKTAAIGTVENKNGKAYFKVEAAWTAFRSTLPLVTGSTCAHELDPKLRYVLVSFNSVEKIEKREMGFMVCDSLVLEASKARDWIEKLEKMKVGSPQSPITR